MSPVFWITFWGLLFVGTHILLPAGFLRPALCRWMTGRGYRAFYWLVSLATFIPFVVVYGDNKHAGPLLWRTGSLPACWWLSHLLAFLALLSLIAGLVNRSPVGIFGGSKQVKGILKITRSPVFIGFSLLGLSHLLVNGYLGDVVFFGSLPALGLIGSWHQDRRKLVEEGGKYRGFINQTSLLPAVALLRGKQTWEFADIPWLAIVIALILYQVLVVFGVHSLLFGGSPLG